MLKTYTTTVRCYCQSSSHGEAELQKIADDAHLTDKMGALFTQSEEQEGNSEFTGRFFFATNQDLADDERYRQWVDTCRADSLAWMSETLGGTILPVEEVVDTEREAQYQ